jgi:hypothetical protein
MGKTFCIPEEGHFVNQIVMAHDLNAAAHHFPVINMQYWHHVDFFVMFGTEPRAAGVITVESCTNWVTLDGAPTTATKIAFDYYVQGTVAAPTSQIIDGNDIFSARTQCTVPATGIVPVNGVDDIVYCISLDSNQLETDHIGFRIDIADPGAACTAVVFAICSGGRYQGAVQESVTKV